MIKEFKIAPFSWIFLSTYFLLLFLNYAFNGWISTSFALNPQLVIRQFEIWRILTFIFVPGNIESIILVAFVFWFIAPILESGFNRAKFVLMFIMTALLQGTLFTFLFIRNHQLYTGAEGMALLILSLYVFLEVTSASRKVSLKRFISLPSAIIFLMLWFSSVIIHNSFAADENLSVSIISGAFGIMVGTLVFMQIKLMDFITGRKKYRSTHYSVPKPEELIETIAARREIQKQMAYADEDYFAENEISQDYFSEDRLNSILDKISESGRDSLTPDEELFLREYSDNL